MAITFDFNSNGGSSVSSQSVNYNGTATRPIDPTKNGYTFNNWYSDAGLTTVFNFSTAIVQNTTLYAKWQSLSSTTNIVEIIRFVKAKVLSAFPEVLPENCTVGTDSDILQLPDTAFPRIEISCPIVDTSNYTDQYSIDSLLVLGFSGYAKRITMDDEDIYRHMVFGMKLRALMFSLNEDIVNATLQYGVKQVDPKQRVEFEYELINNVMWFGYIVPIELNEPYLKE